MAATSSGLLDGPREQPSAETGAPVVGGDTHGLDLCSPPTSEREVGQEAQLQAARHSTLVGLEHHQPVVGISVDGRERRPVPLVQRPLDGLAPTPEIIVGEQRDDVGNVGPGGLPDTHV